MSTTVEDVRSQNELRGSVYPAGMLFEEVMICRICGTTLHREDTLFEAVPDLDMPGEPSFSILKCRACATASTTPVPSESTISMLYTEVDSSDYEYPEPGVIGRLKDLFAQRRVSAIVRALPSKPTSVLDFGTGGGRFASAAAVVLPAGTVVGTDFGPKPPARSYYAHDRKIDYVPYADLKTHRQSFDLIVARHILEHVHDPVKLLQDLVRMLSENGTLYIEVPNFTSQTAKLLGCRWPLLYVPRHLSHFTRSTLESIIRRAGAHSRIGSCEMPMMGNVVALKLGRSRFDPLFRPLALLLYPMQLVLEKVSNQGTCLFALVRRSAVTT